jgi:cysteinyl-tRNA synthetase
MSWKHLGEIFDIHGGGIDLVFPHHENEIAQSRCAFHTPVMANYWMHNGFLQVEGEKMSKSLGNFVTIRELLDRRPTNRYWGEILRLNMLRTHYRQPMDWTQSSLVESEIIYINLQHGVALASRDRAKPSAAVLAALKDDVNTPAVITELHKLAVEAKSTSGKPADAAAELLDSLLLLGFDRAVEHANPHGARRDILRSIQEVKARDRGLDPKYLDERVAARSAARKAKNFTESDRIRDELATMGVVLKDTKDDTTWEIE